MVRIRQLLGCVLLALVAASALATAAGGSGPPAAGTDGPPTAGTDGSPAAIAGTDGPPAAVAGQAQPRTDNTVTRIAVHPNGSATWTIEIRTRLRTDADVERYRAFQRRFRENTSRFLDPFRDRMEGVVAGASDATGREMRAVGFEASTSIQEVPRRWGVVTYSFTWTNFAATDGEALLVGDVFDGGFFLAANDTLAIVAPPGYRIAGVDPPPDGDEDGTVTWVGQRDFADRRPRVRFEPTATATASPTATPTRHVDGGFPLGIAGVVLAVLVLAGGLGLFVWRRGGVPAALLARRRGGSGGPGGSDAGVMTDAERVAALLADEGGRMRQAEIADALGWSASKTSRVLAGMVEDGTVEKLQVGRENLIELAEDD